MKSLNVGYKDTSDYLVSPELEKRSCEPGDESLCGSVLQEGIPPVCMGIEQVSTPARIIHRPPGSTWKFQMREETELVELHPSLGLCGVFFPSSTFQNQEAGFKELITILQKWFHRVRSTAVDTGPGLGRESGECVIDHGIKARAAKPLGRSPGITQVFPLLISRAPPPAP